MQSTMASEENQFTEPRQSLSPAASPATPTDRPRSRFDQHYQTPTQSPMIQITEENLSDGSPSNCSDLFPPSSSRANKRHSAHFSTPMLYSLENNSSSSLMMPGGNVPGNRSSTASLKYVPLAMPLRNKSPSRNRSPTRDASPSRYRSPSPKKGPFNFKSTNLTAPSANNSRASHRKGHRYKHSSVSMNLFQEPKLRAPLKIPVSYPVPTIREFFGSCSSNQKLKVGWSVFHLALSALTLLCGYSYSLHSLSTLSHLVFYDALGCTTAVLAAVMNNFDVYTESSIKFPFGLGRIKVLFEFALSVSLVFVGCDLISHFVEELIIKLFDSDSEHHHPTSSHSHHSAEHSKDINIILYEAFILLTLVTTVASSTFHDDSHATKSRFSNFRHTITNYPTHLVTLIFTGYLALHPMLLQLKTKFRLDESFSFAISSMIIYLGWRVVRRLGYVVLLSSPELMLNGGISSDVEQRIINLDEFKSNYVIRNLIVSHVHSELVVAMVNLRMMGGTDDEEMALRYKVDDLLRDHWSSKGKFIETTIDIDRI